MDDTFVFKLVLLGDAGVGKSALVLRFVRDEYLEASESTIGAAFLSRSLEVDRQSVEVQIWDTAGQERYRSLAPMYFRGAQAALVVFDITSRVSFEGAKRWVRDLQRSSEEGLVICLAGNKSDLSHLRQVEAAEAEAYAAEAGLFYLETSARTAFNVEKAFLEVARRVPRVNKDASRADGVVMGRSTNAAASAAKASAAAGKKGGGGGGCCA